MSADDKNYFPNEKTLGEIREIYSESNRANFSEALPKEATQTERAKYEVCQYIARYLRENHLRQDELAAMIGIDKSRVSEIVHGKISHFTLDRLIDYSQRLVPDLKIQLRLVA